MSSENGIGIPGVIPGVEVEEILFSLNGPFRSGRVSFPTGSAACMSSGCIFAYYGRDHFLLNESVKAFFALVVESLIMSVPFFCITLWIYI